VAYGWRLGGLEEFKCQQLWRCVMRRRYAMLAQGIVSRSLCRPSWCSPYQRRVLDAKKQEIRIRNLLRNPWRWHQNKWAFTRWSNVVLARLPGQLCRWIASGITYGVVIFVAMNHVVILTACTDERVQAVLGSTAATSYLS
jgi:hypothetical protein